MAYRYPCRPRLEILEPRDCPSTWVIATQAAFGSVSSLPLAWGDKVALQSGVTFYGSLSLTQNVELTSTDPAHPATINAGTADAVVFTDTSGQVDNLNLVGVHAAYDGSTFDGTWAGGGNRGVFFQNRDGGPVCEAFIGSLKITGFDTGDYVVGAYDQVFIDSCTITKGLSSGIDLEGVGSGPYPIQNVQISQCSVKNIPGVSPYATYGNGDGIVWNGVQDVAVWGNTVSYCGANGYAVIGIGCSTSNRIQVHDNIVSHIYSGRQAGVPNSDGDGIDLDVYTWSGSVYNNTVSYCDGACILVGPVGGYDTISGNTLSYSNQANTGYTDVYVWGNTIPVSLNGVDVSSSDAFWQQYYDPSAPV